MSILDRLAARLGYSKATNALDNPPRWLSAYADDQRWKLPDGSLYYNQADLYRRLSYIYTAVKYTSSYAATVPLNVKRMRGEKEVDVPNHDYETLMSNPNPLWSRFEFLRGTYSYTLLTGNCFWWLNIANPNDKPAEMWIIPPANITPIPDGNMFISGYEYDPGNGQKIQLPEWQIVHFREFHPSSEFTGLSGVEPVAVTATADMEIQKWNAQLYGKNNARLPGILAFADPITNTDWAIIQEDIREAAESRNLLLLRNAGKGGVEWKQAVASVADMEITQGRKMNQEEIYSVFAPGLASILAVNATEANARTGKATLIEFAIYPMQVAVAEKITSEIMPAYSTPQITYKAEFQDIRITDRAMELNELDKYSQTHTVNEIREKYWEDDKLPSDDERGDLFPVQIKADSGIVEDEPEEPANIPLLPTPTTEQPGEMMNDNVLDQAEENQELKAELDRWKRKATKALKRGDSAAVGFESDIIPISLAGEIAAKLAKAETIEQVGVAFNVSLPVSVPAVQVLEGIRLALEALKSEPAN